MVKDPLCLRNLADGAEYKSVKTALRDQAFSELKAQDDPRMFGRGDVFDKYPYADDSGRGFYERYMRGEKLRAGWVNPTDFEREPLD